MVEMNTEDKRKISWLFGVAFTIFIIALLLYSSLNRPGGAVTNTVGIIESFGGIPKEYGPPEIIATVRLHDGSVIQAHVLSGVIVQKEQVAHVRILRRFLSGTQIYEVYRTEQLK